MNFKEYKKELIEINYKVEKDLEISPNDEEIRSNIKLEKREELDEIIEKIQIANQLAKDLIAFINEDPNYSFVREYAYPLEELVESTEKYMNPFHELYKDVEEKAKTDAFDWLEEKLIIECLWDNRIESFITPDLKLLEICSANTDYKYGLDVFFNVIPGYIVEENFFGRYDVIAEDLDLEFVKDFMNLVNQYCLKEDNQKYTQYEVKSYLLKKCIAYLNKRAKVFSEKGKPSLEMSHEDTIDDIVGSRKF